MALTKDVNHKTDAEAKQLIQTGLTAREQAQVEAEHGLLAGLPLVKDLLDAMPNLVLVLNRDRRILLANQAMLDFLSLQGRRNLTGHRPGSALGCVNATVSEKGCGGSPACRLCGTLTAFTRVRDKCLQDVQECRVTRRYLDEIDALDLRVWATPFEVQGRPYVLLAMMDISHEKRRRALERIFFHDVLNTAGSLRGFAGLLREETGGDQSLVELIEKLSDQLISEIQSQKELLAAESDDLKVNPAVLGTRDLMEGLVRHYLSHEAARNKDIALAEDTAAVVMLTDATILRRVLGNMLKNALEACDQGQTVTLGCRLLNGRSGFPDRAVEFWVHNPGYIPPEIQLQIFNRSFSTKDPHRGLGTYSMRLLSERFLKGQVGFISHPEEGTTFFGRYPQELTV